MDHEVTAMATAGDAGGPPITTNDGGHVHHFHVHRRRPTSTRRPLCQEPSEPQLLTKKVNMAAQDEATMFAGKLNYDGSTVQIRPQAAEEVHRAATSRLLRWLCLCSSITTTTAATAAAAGGRGRRQETRGDF